MNNELELCPLCKNKLHYYDDYGTEYLYCEYCGSAFDPETGKELPHGPDDPGDGPESSEDDDA